VGLFSVEEVVLWKGRKVPQGVGWEEKRISYLGNRLVAVDKSRKKGGQGTGRLRSRQARPRQRFEEGGKLWTNHTKSPETGTGGFSIPKKFPRQKSAGKVRGKEKETRDLYGVIAE